MLQIHGHLETPAAAEQPAGACGEAAATPAGHDPALDPQPGTWDMVQGGEAEGLLHAARRATRFATRPMEPPPGRSDEDSRAAFQSLRISVDQGAVQIWEYVDTIAFDLDLYVAIHPRPVDGLAWPQFFRHPEKEGATIAYAFTREDTARQMMEPPPPERLRLHHLSGIEAMRWIYNTPQTIDDVAIDLYKGTDGWAMFPHFWALSAIYPHFVDIESLDQVAAVGLPRLGALPGARGLKPEAVKAMIAGRGSLSGMTGPDGGAAGAVEHDGRRYLPVFSDPDQFFAFASQRPDYKGRPAPVDGGPPFAGWLRAALGHDGVLLDPAGPAPLPLDHTDLLVLDLWLREGNGQPKGWTIASEIARLHYEQVLSDRVAALIVADWPRYFMIAQQTPEGGVNLLKIPDPDSDRLPVFTTADAAETYIRVFRNMELLKEEWQVVPILHRWDTSVFHNALDNFDDGAWVDPIALGGGGLPVNRSMLETIIERIDEKLKPRIPGFVWEE
jgi:hypothetical protein